MATAMWYGCLHMAPKMIAVDIKEKKNGTWAWIAIGRKLKPAKCGRPWWGAHFPVSNGIQNWKQIKGWGGEGIFIELRNCPVIVSLPVWIVFYTEKDVFVVYVALN